MKKKSLKHADQMSRWVRAAAIVGLGIAALTAPTGCGGRQQGPLERAGHEIDDAAEDVDEEVDEATE
jgi:hypothetical protein